MQTGKDAINIIGRKSQPPTSSAKADKHGNYEHSQLETYDYTRRLRQQGATARNAPRFASKSVQALDDHRIAVGAAPSLFPGGKLTTEEIAAKADNKEYVVLRCTHSYVDQTYISGGGAPVAYAGTYEMMDSSRQFRSLLTTRRPVVVGWQSALVVADKGNESEEIDVDKEGCILLKFYWDRKKDMSRRVRVAQFWAGKHARRLVLPAHRRRSAGRNTRTAIPTGRWSSAPSTTGDNEVPTKLPDKKTHSGILTKSSKNSDGYHMLMFDDTKDQERVKLRSQKDLMFKALNNEQRDILMDQTENIGKDETINVGMDMAHDMQKGGGNWTLNAFKTATINVGPKDMPMTQIKMTQTGHHAHILSGPECLFSKTVMTPPASSITVMMGLTQPLLDTGVDVADVADDQRTRDGGDQHDGAGGRQRGGDAQHAGAGGRRRRRRRHTDLRSAAMTSRIRFTDALDVFDSVSRARTLWRAEARRRRRAARLCAPLDRLAATCARRWPFSRICCRAARRSGGAASASARCSARRAGRGSCGSRCNGCAIPTRRRGARRWTFAQGDLVSPTSWLARAVGYSGGSLLAPEQPPMAAPPEACAQSVNAAIVLAATRAAAVADAAVDARLRRSRRTFRAGRGGEGRGAQASGPCVAQASGPAIAPIGRGAVVAVQALFVVLIAPMRLRAGGVGRGAFERARLDIDDVAAERRLIFELRPGDREMIAAEAEEPAERHDRIDRLARALVDHHVVNRAELLAMRVEDVGALHLARLDERMALVAGRVHECSPVFARK